MKRYVAGELAPERGVSDFEQAQEEVKKARADDRESILSDLKSNLQSTPVISTYHAGLNYAVERIGARSGDSSKPKISPYKTFTSPSIGFRAEETTSPLNEKINEIIDRLNELSDRAK